MAGGESTPLSQQVLLTNVFEIDSIRYRVKLTKTAISWEAERTPKCK